MNQDLGALIRLVDASAGVTSPDQTNADARGLKALVNVTAMNPRASLVVEIQYKDSVSGAYIAILTTSIPVPGLYVMTIYPGITVNSGQSVSDVLSRIWRIATTISGSGVSATVGVQTLS